MSIPNTGPRARYASYATPPCRSAQHPPVALPVISDPNLDRRISGKSQLRKRKSKPSSSPTSQEKRNSGSASQESAIGDSLNSGKIRREEGPHGASRKGEPGSTIERGSKPRFASKMSHPKVRRKANCGRPQITHRTSHSTRRTHKTPSQTTKVASIQWLSENVSKLISSRNKHQFNAQV